MVVTSPLSERQQAPRERARLALARTLDEGAVSLAGQGVIALCSGGVDSVCLVDLLAHHWPTGRRPGRIHVLFADHGLRDVEADRTASKAVASAVGAPWQEIVAPTATFARGNLQAAARAWRYDAAARIAREVQASFVATGHHADDAIESVLLGLTTSSGLRAIAGIPVSRQLANEITCIHPLLGLTHAQLVAHALEHELQWAEDPTNTHNDYRRNRLRHDVVPVLSQINPALALNLERTASQARNAVSALDALADAFLDAHARAAPATPFTAPAQPTASVSSLPRAQLAALPKPALAAVLAAWLRRHHVGRGISQRVVNTLVSAVTDERREERSFDVRGACVRCDRYDVVLQRSH